MNMLHDLWEWVVAVFEQWHGYVSGGVVAFALEYGEKLWEWKPPRKAIWTILLVGLFFSLFSAWREQKEKAESIKRELDALKNPILSGNVVASSAAPSGEKEQDTLVTILVHLKNLGAPTALETYSFRSLRDGRTTEGLFIPPPPNSLILRGGKDNKDTVVLATKDHLYMRTSNQALQTNVPVDCWFSVLLRGEARDEIYQNRTTFTFSFTDAATGQTHEITHNPSIRNTEFIDIQKLQSHQPKH